MNTLKKILLSLGLFLLIKHFLSSEGFWQKFIVCGLGIWFLGLIQIVFWIFAGIFIWVVISTKNERRKGIPLMRPKPSGRFGY